MTDVLLVNATEELQSLAEELGRAGFRVDTCASGEAADRLLGGAPVDAILINLMDLPADTTLRSLLEAKKLPTRTATLGLVRPSALPDLDLALPLDDFIVVPATPEELVARIRRAAWRRSGGEGTNVLRSGDLSVDLASYKAFVAGRPISLTYKEYELLRFLVEHQGRVCSREMLLSQVWGYDFYGGARTVDVHIRRLRSKIENGTHSFIETVRNVGYRFQAS